MERIGRRSLVDDVVDRMRSEIVSGRWTVGSRIPSESDLGAQLNVGRSSVRQAVRSLVQVGLLETKHGVGTFVIATDPDEVSLSSVFSRSEYAELVVVRRCLDGLAAHEAARFRNGDDVQHLRRLLEHRAVAVEEGDSVRAAEADRQFHSFIVECSKNKLLMCLYASIDRSVHSSLSGMTSLSSLNNTAEHHRAIATAISQRDPLDAQAAAVRIVDEHERDMNSEPGRSSPG